MIHEELFGLSVPRPGVTASTDEAGRAATAAVTRAATRYLDEARRVLASRWPCLLSTLLGGLGALTSAAQRSTKVVSSRIPQLLGSSVASLSRIPIGMVAGVSIWLLSRAAVGADAAHATDMLLAAFAAGFAERLLVQSTAPAGGTDPDAHARNPA